MRRKIIMILMLILLLLFAMTPLASLRVNADETEVETTDFQPAGVVFIETFESAFPGTAWSVGDWNSGGGYDYWNKTSYRVHAGTMSGWCAAVGTQSVKTTIFTENFESSFPGTAWSVGDWNPDNGYDYWDDVNVRAHGGSKSAWCNGYPDPDAAYYDDYMQAYMYETVNLGAYSTVYLSYYYYVRSELNGDSLYVMYFSDGAWHWVDRHTGDLGNAWYSSTVSIPNTATYVGFWFYSNNAISTWVGAYVDDVELYGYKHNYIAHKYDVKMDAYMYRAVNLSSFGSVTLSYLYWLNSETGHDYLRVMYYSGGSMYYVDSHSGNSGGWTSSSVTIPKSATYVGFYFFSDTTNAASEGAYIDDVVLTGTLPTYSVTINAYCNTEGAYVSRPITMDGSSTGYNTPHTFTVSSGTHNFTVPSKDSLGHHFKQWSTGSTSTTITVNSTGTYTAYYETPDFEIWTDKAMYAIGETMTVYVRVRNMGPATPVRAIIRLQLPNASWYGPLLDMTATLPADFDSGNYAWNSFKIPAAPLGTYKWLAELRNPTTNALIDSDTWTWTLT